MHCWYNKLKYKFIYSISLEMFSNFCFKLKYSTVLKYKKTSSTNLLIFISNYKNYKQLYCTANSLNVKPQNNKYDLIYLKLLKPKVFRCLFAVY